MFEKQIVKIKNENNYRELKYINGIDFSSNDYLGLTNHPKIKEAIINALNKGLNTGSGGSRLLTGNKKEHLILEEFASDYFKRESCLFFSSGFLANYAIFTTLPDRKDFIIYDEFIHASARDGIKSSNAKSVKFKHNDLDSLKEKIEKAKSLNANSIWIAIESIYSMDGDVPYILGILQLIRKYENTYLIIDEAHATGIFGLHGKGFSYGLNNKNIIVLHTCGKALGVSGALVCASREVIEYMINKSRPFIYTTAESPLIAVAVKEALIISQEESWHRENLLKLIEYTHQNYSDIINSKHKTQIIPIILNNNTDAINKASTLQSKGFNVRAIRPPTVPSSRLRISINANRTEQEIDSLFNLVGQVCPKAVKLIKN